MARQQTSLIVAPESDWWAPEFGAHQRDHDSDVVVELELFSGNWHVLEIAGGPIFWALQRWSPLAINEL